MVGGNEADFRHIEPLLKDLAPKDGYMYCGAAGAGHFVKMVHNGIEYGMMQAYGEGFEILQASPYKPDSGKVAKLWNQGSVVRSWLLELAERAFAKDKDLSGLMDFVQDSGEGRWTVEQAIETGVPAPTIALSLFARFSSQQTESFAGKVLAALRQEFGGQFSDSIGRRASLFKGAAFIFKIGIHDTGNFTGINNANGGTDSIINSVNRYIRAKGRILRLENIVHTKQGRWMSAVQFNQYLVGQT
jgi:6-phosphogluconate dehydrogenase